MTLFAHQHDSSVGPLTESTESFSSFLMTGVYENDIYEFSIDDTDTINLSLYGISTGDDADLEVYQDNGDGVLDASDELVIGSYNSENADELLNFQGGPGTYFARVSLYEAGTDNYMPYTLDLSTTPATEATIPEIEYDISAVEEVTQNYLDRQLEIMTVMAEWSWVNDIPMVAPI